MSKNLPKEIHGVCFHDGWEFDMPCIIYKPFYVYGEGGNSGYLDSMVESVCIDICLREFKSTGEVEDQCKHRGWSLRGLNRRKRAVHVKWTIEWYYSDDGELDFEIVHRSEQGQL